MGRLIALVVVIVIIVLVIGGVLLAAYLRDRAERSAEKDLDRKQRALAKYAPQVLRGDPLVDIVIMQGAILEDGYCVVSELLRTSPVVVMMPEDLRGKLEDWTDSYQRSKMKEL